ncbi:MFS transporter [Rhodococcus sp. NPDC056960]|uniref:MFS transporter n=1 Tax=Rhodococcus sp. NPDC056960 TaxID=3345982 RepID=UPI00364168BD
MHSHTPINSTPEPGEAGEHRRAVWAVAGTFMLHGFIFSTWVSRIPTVRGALGLTNGQLGALMLALSAGALIVLPFTGMVVGRFGANKTVVRTSMMFVLGLATVAFGADYAVATAVVGGLFVLEWATRPGMSR